jgi:hypothetical protein
VGVKNVVCREKVKNVNELPDRIDRAAEFVTNEMLVSSWRETEYGLYVRHSTNGAHIEIY